MYKLMSHLSHYFNSLKKREGGVVVEPQGDGEKSRQVESSQVLFYLFQWNAQFNWEWT